ncbi:MAG: helix-turn-helix domain-containing protein [Pseudobdellovibrionaceae bacterium]
MKSKNSFPQWKGFEASPQGCLLEQVIDLTGEFGFAYERSCDFYKDFHTHDRLMLIFPRGSSSMRVRVHGQQMSLSIDSEHVLTVPRNIEHDDESTSSIYDTVAFYPSEELLSAAVKKLGVSAAHLTSLKGNCLKFRRSRRLEQLAQDYFFERVISKSTNQAELDFLGRRIIEESLKVLFSESSNILPENRNFKNGEVTQLALRYIESNLFESIELKTIAKISGASVATLLRKFKSDISQTPYSYIKNRRLEEAFRLLSSGLYNVGQVASLVGYENFGAFSDAFKSKYKRSPSSCLKR